MRIDTPRQDLILFSTSRCAWDWQCAGALQPSLYRLRHVSFLCIYGAIERLCAITCERRSVMVISSELSSRCSIPTHRCACSTRAPCVRWIHVLNVRSSAAAYTGVRKKMHSPRKSGFFWRNSSLLHKHEFSLINPQYGVKLHEESKYFIRIFATRLYSSLFCCSSLCEKVQNLRV